MFQYSVCISHDRMILIAQRSLGNVPITWYICGVNARANVKLFPRKMKYNKEIVANR